MSEEYNLARGFSTLIMSNTKVANSITSVKDAIVATLDMNARFHADPATAKDIRETNGALRAAPASSSSASAAPVTTPAPPTVSSTWPFPHSTNAAAPPTVEEHQNSAFQNVVNTLRKSDGMVAGSRARAVGDAAAAAGSNGATSAATAAASGAAASGAAASGGDSNNKWGPASGRTSDGKMQPGGVEPTAQSGSGGGVGSIGPGWMNNLVTKIPGVTTAISAVNTVNEEMNKNEKYQRIEGGSQLEAASERVMEEQYRAQSLGIFSGAEAQQAFYGATKLGYGARGQSTSRTNRQDAVDFLYDAKKSRGEDLSESLPQLKVASESASVNLKTLNAALEGVSQTAGKAGVNTEEMRKKFTDLLSLGISSGQGAGSVGMASAITQTSSMYGKAFANGTDASGMYSQDMEYRAASASGMTQHALHNLKRNDPTAALAVMDKMVGPAMAAGGVTAEMKTWVQKQVADLKTSGGLLDESNSMDIAREMLDTFPGINDEVFVKNIGQLSGMDFGGDVEKAAQWVVQNIGGQGVAAVAAVTLANAGKLTADGKTASGVQAQRVDANGNMVDVAKSIDEFSASVTSSRGQSIWGKTDRANAANVYIDQAKADPNARNGMTEALLTNSALQGDDADNQMVEVQTSSGRKVVSLTEAVKTFPNEVASGQIKFVGGTLDNKTVSQVTGLNTVKTDISAEIKKGAPKDALTTAVWEAKNNPDANSGANGNGTTIGLTSAAAQLVVLLGQGKYGASAAAGTPPVPDPTGVSRAGSGIKDTGGAPSTSYAPGISDWAPGS